MTAKAAKGLFVVVLGLGLASCEVTEECPTLACPHDVTIAVEPPIAIEGELGVSVELDGGKIECWVPESGKASCAAGEGFSVRDVAFEPSGEGAADLARIVIHRQPAEVRLTMSQGETPMFSETVKPVYADERYGNLTCEGEPYMCKVGRAKLSTNR